MASDEIELRDATVADAEAIGRVYVETWRDAYAGILPADYLAKLSVARLRTSWTRTLRAGTDTVIVAVSDGVIAGFSSGGAEITGDAFFRGEIFTLYVSPDAQRRGIGGQLLLAMLDRLHDRAPVLVWVLTRNDGAARFYEEHGGVPVRKGSHVVGGVDVAKTAYAFFDVS